MLWHRRHVSFGVIVVATVGWFLFERSGLPFLPICSDVLLLLILFRFTDCIVGMVNRYEATAKESSKLCICWNFVAQREQVTDGFHAHEITTQKSKWTVLVQVQRQVIQRQVIQVQHRKVSGLSLTMYQSLSFLLQAEESVEVLRASDPAGTRKTLLDRHVIRSLLLESGNLPNYECESQA